MNRKIIFIDVDDTLNELIDALLRPYREKYNHSICKDDLTDYYINPFLKKECKNLFQEFCTEELLVGLDIVPYAKEVVEQLMSKHDVYFVTAGHPKTIGARDKWLNNHLDGYTSSQMIRCANKTLLQGHLLIDDCWYNHLGSNIDYSILMNQPYNKKYEDKLKDNMIMCSDWKEIGERLHEINWL